MSESVKTNNDGADVLFAVAFDGTEKSIRRRQQAEFPHTAQPFAPQSVWRCTNLQTGLSFEVSGPLAANYLGCGDPNDTHAAATRTLIEKKLTNHFTKNGLFAELKT